MKILFVDDSEADLRRFSAFCVERGFAPLTARNGEQAVEAFSRERPDLVMMNAVLPVMDGFEATARIKSLSLAREGQWIPVILMTRPQGEQDFIRGMQSGADDYLDLPLSLDRLGEKLKMFARMDRMQRDLSEGRRALRKYEDKAEREFAAAKAVMEKILGYGWLAEGRTQSWIMPANDFSGDVIASASAQNTKRYVLLADAAGHGLPAALIVLHVTRTFYGMAEKGCSPEAILEELNWRINTQLPTGHFLAATLACIDLYEGLIRVWNGGNPPAWYVDDRGEVLKAWASRHLPLGIQPKEHFAADMEEYLWREEGQLIMCSDGLLEAETPQGEAFGQARMQGVIREAGPGERFAALQERLKAHLGSGEAHDDISLVMIRCPVDEFWEKAAAGPSPQADPWHFYLELGPEKLKTLDILPLLLEWLSLADIRKTKSGAIFVVLSELYSNALEHGLLHMDPALKLLPNGFERYMAERSRRLARLEEGTITVEMNQSRAHARPVLVIRIQDTGSGFDYETVLQAPRTEETSPWGRGIPLVKSLCSELHYRGGGNEAVAYYEL